MTRSRPTHTAHPAQPSLVHPALHRSALVGASIALACALGACASTGSEVAMGEYSSAPRLIAESLERQWTGVAWIGASGDVVVNYPRWTEPYTHAVELIRSGAGNPPLSAVRTAYPNRAMNAAGNPEQMTPAQRREVFVAVQSVHTDRQGRLWILDTGNPRQQGVLEGGAKLVMVNPSTGRVERTYAFGPDIARRESYLNDVRIDIRGARAYITDSGDGALIVVDLDTGDARRILDDHPSTHADADFTPVIGARAFIDRQTGRPPQIHADGIALSPDGRHLYWQALTGRTLYRLPTRVLSDFSLDDSQIAAEIEDMGRTVVTDGMVFDGRGNLYFTALEHDAVMFRTPTGEIRTLWSSPDLAWPDSFSYDAVQDVLYVTTAQIHRMPDRAGPSTPWPPIEPFRIYRFDLSSAD